MYIYIYLFIIIFIHNPWFHTFFFQPSKFHGANHRCKSIFRRLEAAAGGDSAATCDASAVRGKPKDGLKVVKRQSESANGESYLLIGSSPQVGVIFKGLLIEDYEGNIGGLLKVPS